MEKENMKYNV